ncbi:MAG: MXAN_6640 family putative metalloprotease [Candidatus Neomarinimicrobiota bacterium]
MKKIFQIVPLILLAGNLLGADVVDAYRELLEQKQLTLNSGTVKKSETRAIKSVMISPSNIRKILGKALYTRPSLSNEYVTPEGHFRIHYTMTGYDAVSTTVTNSRNVPDYVWEVGIAAERSYSLLIDTLGFDPPPSDNGMDGVEIDIYIKNWAGSAYAWTYPEDEVTATSRQYDYTGYTIIDNDYAEPAYNTNGLDGMRVTVAHEFFHIIQMGYNWWENNGLIGVDDEMGDAYFLEWCSTWFEERAYPEINDYFGYLSDFFNDPNNPVWSDAYWYSLGIFVRFLIEQFPDDPDFMATVWETIKTKYAFQALEQTIENESGASLALFWNEFARRCYYTGVRYDTRYALSDDAKEFPQLYVLLVNRQKLTDRIDFSSTIQQFSTQQFLITFSADLFVGLSASASGDGNLIGGYLLDRFGSTSVSRSFSIGNDVIVGDALSKDTLVVFMTNSSTTSTSTVNLSVIAIPDSQVIPVKFLALYPNPFLIKSESELFLEFQLGRVTTDVNMALYNLRGGEIFHKKIDRGFLCRGVNTIGIPSEEIGAGYVASGIHFVTIRYGQKSFSKKLMILK